MGPGQDGCHGEAGDDRLYGGPDADQLYGGAGFDYCDGGPGVGRSHELRVAGPAVEAGGATNDARRGEAAGDRRSSACALLVLGLSTWLRAEDSSAARLSSPVGYNSRSTAWARKHDPDRGRPQQLRKILQGLFPGTFRRPLLEQDDQRLGFRERRQGQLGGTRGEVYQPKAKKAKKSIKSTLPQRCPGCYKTRD